ncbi:hypothetical protein BDR07DRAFT_1386621 [Suillus spraguei]|nr:hypothetical protein BDR07DRAFT_1386621 [Suillus spraguei]
MCALVALFHALLDPAYRPLVAELMTGLAAVTHDTLRRGCTRKSLLSSFASLLSLEYSSSFFSFAVIMPIYYVVFILSGAAIGSPVKGRSTRITQGSAEALLFALIVGYIIPTVCMVILQDITTTALWQGYPIIMALAQFVYLVIRPSHDVESGHATIQAMYGLIFVTSAIFHVYYTWPLVFDIQEFQKVLVPQLALSKRPLSLPEGVAAVIQWDAVFGIGSTLLMTFWFAQSVKEMVLLLVWHVLSSVVFGPGAAIAGVLLFREARLNSLEDKED